MSGAPSRLSLSSHREALRRTALRLCRNEADADDLVQEVFVRAMRNEESFAPGTNELAWLTRILTNLFIDYCRERKRKTMVQIDENIGSYSHEEVELPVWANISSDEFMVAVSKLSEPFQQTYRWHALEQISYEEISRRLSISVQTVGSRMHRARSKLKELLASKLPVRERERS